MIVFPNAKINLGLRITGRRSDGFHNLETVFCPIGVTDVLEVVEGSAEPGGITFVQQGLDVKCDAESNLVVKAYRMLQHEYSLPPVTAVLYKKIPFGAGLGGGSADATFMLMALNDMFGLGLDEARLEEMASKLGADCPFFVKNRPVFAEGTGNIFTEMPQSFSLKGYGVALVKPDVFVSTKEAFSGVTISRRDTSLKDDIMVPVGEWKNVVANDFEQSIFPLHPEIAAIKDKLYSLGAVYASMSGSGSSVYGIFAGEPQFGREEFEGCFFWKGML